MVFMKNSRKLNSGYQINFEKQWLFTLMSRISHLVLQKKKKYHSMYEVRLNRIE